VGVSQEQLANAALVERSHMGKIERGEHMPNLVLILRIAEALQVRPGLLVDEVVTYVRRAQRQ
jgi:transcriptional regulator with XRE-family HTH domain